MKSLFDKDYYENGIETGKSCYSHYRWMPELTLPLAFTLIEYLNIKESDTLLDFGCAKGYLVKALRLLHREAWGVDSSEYALDHAPQEVREFLYSKIPPKRYDWIIAKDVLEHIPYEDLNSILLTIAQCCKNCFAIIPLGGCDTYNIAAYELDITHIVREDLSWWAAQFEQVGLTVIDSCFGVKGIKENWKHPKGNGFFRLGSK